MKKILIVLLAFLQKKKLKYQKFNDKLKNKHIIIIIFHKL